MRVSGVLVLAVVLLAAAGTQAVQTSEAPSVPAGHFEGTWSWGAPLRSAEVPFVRISRPGGTWSIQTKHYMHDNFVATSKGIRIDGNHLEFTYWYEPLRRWATCRLDLGGGIMTGTCDGELDAHRFGPVPTWLWPVVQ